MKERNLILAIDVGSTNCKAAVVNKSGKVLKLAVKPVSVISPRIGWSEICPHKLWSDIYNLIHTVSVDFRDQILSLGISVQRNTFITWNKDTGEYLHNFITWMDKRSSLMCLEWNNGYFKNAAQWAAWFIGTVSGSHRMLCASTFSAKDKSIPMRLKWILTYNKKASLLLKNKKLCVGTIETWLIWKLTGGRTWATEFSCASSTGLFDIWRQSWSSIMTYFFGIPQEILPEVKSSNDYFGHVDKNLGFGFSIPITGVLGDQQASMFGNLLFDEGNTKLTLGTVISCSINTGANTHPTSTSIYPLIGWKLKGEEPSFIAEFFASNGGKAIDWTVNSGLVNNVNEIDSVARKVSNSNGVTFVPAFNGVEVPQKVVQAETSLFGITSQTKTSHIVRAVLESQAFLSCHVLDCIFEHYRKPREIVVDGGSSRSSLIIETVAHLSSINIKKSDCVDGSVMGAALISGLGSGLYQSLDDIRSSVRLDFKVTSHRSSRSDEKIKYSHRKWHLCVEKCCNLSQRLP